MSLSVDVTRQEKWCEKNAKLVVEGWQFLGWCVSRLCMCACTWRCASDVCLGCVRECAHVWCAHTRMQEPLWWFSETHMCCPWRLSDWHPSASVSAWPVASFLPELSLYLIFAPLLLYWLLDSLMYSWLWKNPESGPWSSYYGTLQTWNKTCLCPLEKWAPGRWHMLGEQSVVFSHPHGWSLGWVLLRRLLTAQEQHTSSGLVSGCWAPGGSSCLPSSFLDFPPIFHVWDTSEKQSTGQDLPPSFLLVNHQVWWTG